VASASPSSPRRLGPARLPPRRTTRAASAPARLPPRQCPPAAGPFGRWGRLHLDKELMHPAVDRVHQEALQPAMNPSTGEWKRRGAVECRGQKQRGRGDVLFG